MNTYHVIRVESGHWVLEWRVNGVRRGLVWGWFATEGEALFAACDLARMEYLEGAGERPCVRRTERRRGA